MITSLDIIDRLPFELAARLEADDYFQEIPVTVAESGNVKLEMERKQAALAFKTNKRGVAVIILQIVADDDYPELALGPLTLKPAIQVVENVELNKPPLGIGKSARQVSRRIRDVIKTLALPGLVTDLTTDNPAIFPITKATDIAANLVMYQINFKCFEAEEEQGPSIPQVCADPHFVDNGNGTLSLTSATPGAAIWYTLDDTYPSPRNTQSATLFSAPIIATAQGFYIRAAAYLPGWIASNPVRAFLSA